MQTWARRGLQTALVTGGLLMLGTGIASADEDVNPDRPASPLDGSVRVPVHLDNNALGTPLGQKNLPSVDKEIRLDAAELTGSLPLAERATSTLAPALDKAADLAAPVADRANPLLAKAQEQAEPVLDKATPLTDELGAATAERGLPAVPAVPSLTVPTTDGALMGNRVDGDLVVPVDISGNAIALLGEAEVTNDSAQSYSDSESVVTDGAGGFLAGNVVDLDWALPVQITGNAIAGAGHASSTSTATQDTSVTSDVTTDGSRGVLSGNVLAGHWATPFQVTGNAIAGVGQSESDSTADTNATAGGTVLTTGADSLGSGNIGAVPIATPVEANGNAIAGAGSADATSMSSATAMAGALRNGLYGVPTYLETNGDPAVAAGNIVQPAVSGPALLCGNAGAAVGTATSDCASDSSTTAGGTTRSTGEGSVLSGSTAVAPTAVPVEGFGNAAAGVGTADALADNTVSSTAGGDSYTRGHDSLASGTVASVSPTGPVDVFGNAVGGAGSASAEATQDADTATGGHTGTTGDDSVGGGNLATVPVATPVETFGNVAGAVGGAEASASETKVTSSGGGSNTDDPNGVLASNNLTAPVAGAAQAFGNGGGAVAFTDAEATTDNEVVAGGDAQATGIGGAGSGNIGQVPVSVPAQVFGTGASALAGGEQTATNYSTLTAGGNAHSDGQGGLLAGNVASGPIGSAAQAFGESAAVLGVNESEASSVTSSVAGGDVATDGTGGLGTGNVVSPQALPVAQSFAAVASGVGGGNWSMSDNTSVASSGGDIDTAGDSGFLAGNLVDVPAGAVAQPFGDAVAAIASNSSAFGDNVSYNSVGGTSTTSGQSGSLSGIDGTIPVGANAPIYDVPVEVLAQAFTDSVNVSQLSVGEQAGQLDFPVTGAGMSPAEVPSLQAARSLQHDHEVPFAGVFSGVLDGFAGGMTGVPGQDQVTAVADMVSGTGEYHVLPHPLPEPRSDAPFGTADLPLDGTPLAHVPVDDLTDLANVANVPAAGDLPGLADGLPAADGLTDVSVLTAELPAAGDLAGGLPATTQLPTVPAVPEVADPTAELPAVGDVDVTEIVPTVPSIGEVPAPSLNTMPFESPALSGLDTASIADDASLSDTRAALANLFTAHPIG